MKIKSRAFSLLTAFLIIFAASNCANTVRTQEPVASVRELAPTPDLSETTVEIVDFLKAGHYRQMQIDDALSAKLLNQYVRDLDKSHSYFTIQDIDDFQRFRTQLDDDLQHGKLTAGYYIFNRYQQRMIERLTYVLRLLDAGLDQLDFGKDETLAIDREKAPWPKDTEALDNLSRKRLKNAVLNLRLSGKTDEEITEKLKSRYRNQLKRVQQVNSDDVFQTYINAFTGLYDPHTQYFSPRTSENFDINMKLSLEGIGAVLQADDEYTKVIRLVPAGPADKAGQLKPADRIIGVGQGKNGKVIDVTGWRLDDVVHLIRGPKGTVVRLELLGAEGSAGSAPKVIAITRDMVKLEEQSAKKEIIDVKRGAKTYKVGVISIPTFYLDFKAKQAGDPDYKSTTRDVHRLLIELKRKNIDGLVIDLRNNGGGSLQEAISLTGLFIRTGPLVLIRNPNGQIQVMGDRDPSVAYRGPLAVLVNRMSASASEIFAGAIQDYQRGLVIGGQTFGKGTVQALHALDRGQLKLTQSKFYRISGASTQNKGVMPDVSYPSIYDADEIGESALPNALPWDTITTGHHPNHEGMAALIGKLRVQHDTRASKAPGFEYLLERQEYLDKIKGKTTVSLNEAVRRKERVKSDAIELELENKRRSLLGLKPIDKLSELEEEQIPDTANKIDKNDPLLKESAQVLMDFVALAQPIVAKNSGADPLQ